MEKIFIVFDEASDKEVSFVPHLVDVLPAANVCMIKTRFMDSNIAIDHIKEKVDFYGILPEEALIFHAGENLAYIKQHFPLAKNLGEVIKLMTKIVGGNETMDSRELIGDFFVASIKQHIV